MGNRFLSHIERTKVLLFLIDGTVRGDIKRTYKMLINELRSYNEELMNKKRVIVVNKIDTWKRKRTKEFEEYFLNMGEPVFFISAIKKEGLRELLQNLYEVSLAYKKVDEETSYEERVVEVDEKLLDKVLKIERVDANTFKVSQKEIERRAELSDFKKPGSFEELRRYFERIELEKQLKVAGIKEGDRVIIGNKGFIYKENG
jgi:GTP-binding protein